MGATQLLWLAALAFVCVPASPAVKSSGDNATALNTSLAAASTLGTRDYDGGFTLPIPNGKIHFGGMDNECNGVPEGAIRPVDRRDWTVKTDANSYCVVFSEYGCTGTSVGIPRNTWMGPLDMYVNSYRCGLTALYTFDLLFEAVVPFETPQPGRVRVTSNEGECRSITEALGGKKAKNVLTTAQSEVCTVYEGDQGCSSKSPSKLLPIPELVTSFYGKNYKWWKCDAGQPVTFGIRLCPQVDLGGDCREFPSQGYACVNIPNAFAITVASLETFTRPYDQKPYCFIYSTSNCAGNEALSSNGQRYPRLSDYGLNGRVYSIQCTNTRF